MASWEMDGKLHIAMCARIWLYEGIYIYICISAVCSCSGEYTYDFTDSTGFGHLSIIRWNVGTCLNTMPVGMSVSV